MSGMVTIEYTPPKSAPAHVANEVNVKGRIFPVGVKVICEPHIAAACLNGMDGWWKVHSGEPKARAPIAAATPKDVGRANATAAQSMEVNGSRALSALPVLSEAAIKALRLKGSEADKMLDDGAFDKEAALIAVLLHTIGEADRAKLYAERAQRVANAAAVAQA